ncbi:prepilin peptidase, partial [Glaesserella parasuis]|nr:prepilin peptidase [Glaesserella parasuis]MCT8774327.1 prepilin peptidase [Glaesserella parasuis]
LYYLTDIRYVSIIFVLALWQLLFYHSIELNSHIFSLFITILFFSLFSLLSQLIYKKESLGLGDILLFIALSPLFTFDEMILLLLYASLFGLTFYAIYFLFTKQKLTRLPFIPFISLSTLWGIIAKI